MAQISLVHLFKLVRAFTIHSLEVDEAESFIDNIPLYTYTGNLLIATSTNSKDPDKMPQNAAFHRKMHSSLR